MNKVLLFTDSDVFAGTERHILDLARALRDLGDSITVACPTEGVLARKAREARLDVLPIEKRGRLDLAALARLYRELRQRRFDIIHAHNGRTALLAGLAVLLSRRGRFIATQHFLDPAHVSASGVKARLGRWMHRWLAASSFKIIAISEAVRAAILARRAAKPGKVSVVLNGIDDPSGKGIASSEATRASLNVPTDAFLVVTPARLAKEKGIDVLIQAMAQVVAQVPQARCVVAGEGPERHALQVLIDAAGLARSVTLLGFRSDVLSVVAASNVFVLPSHAEPFGLAILEAMALGVPAIACRSGGPVEILENERTGLLVSPGNPAELAEAILRVWREPMLAGELISNARRRFDEQFTARTMASRMHDIYDSAHAASSR